MPAALLTADELVGALDTLDVHFLTGGEASPRARRLPPADLLAQLAAQPDARMRLAIIPLLLRRPEFAATAPVAAELITGQTRWTLKLYYTAAVLLQRCYRDSLARLLGPQQPLHDLFGAELGVLPLAVDPREGLRRLGERHTALTGLTINWAGTYDHAAQRLIKRLEHEALWINQQAA